MKPSTILHITALNIALNACGSSQVDKLGRDLDPAETEASRQRILVIIEQMIAEKEAQQVKVASTPVRERINWVFFCENPEMLHECRKIPFDDVGAHISQPEESPEPLTVVSIGRKNIFFPAELTELKALSADGSVMQRGVAEMDGITEIEGSVCTKIDLFPVCPPLPDYTIEAYDAEGERYILPIRCD